MNKNLLAILVLCVLIVSGMMLMSNKAVAPEQTVESAVATTTAIIPVEASTTTAVIADVTQKFTITGQNFSFAPKEIRVKKGDRVQILFKNSGGFHDLKIDEFKAATKQIKGGAEEMVEFVASKTGTFEYYCSVGEHRVMGMKGNLIVE